ncbi:hypothetical protein BRC63_04615 [Halobacteriales archaeon QH_10_70_21]|nr:MAG: hypothetical protein BRC63_04615 [Halobacteriales archaeon QH_10_70_21]
MPHNIDVHAVYGPGGGAEDTTVTPGETATIRFRAMYPDVFIYHCAVPNMDQHISAGMFGAILVEPEDDEGAGGSEPRGRGGEERGRKPGEADRDERELCAREPAGVQRRPRPDGNELRHRSVMVTHTHPTSSRWRCAGPARPGAAPSTASTGHSGRSSHRRRHSARRPTPSRSARSGPGTGSRGRRRRRRPRQRPGPATLSPCYAMPKSADRRAVPSPARSSPVRSRELWMLWMSHGTTRLPVYS